MISDYRCFYCFTKAFGKLLEKENISNEAKNSFTNDMIGLYQNVSNEFSAPEFARELHRMLRSYTLNADPYKEVKKENNDQALLMLPKLEEIVKKSEDPFDTALRLAIAGNIIDLAVNDSFNLDATINKCLDSDLSIDHSGQLKEALEKAKKVLYLGDNAGEIVFDQIFIKTIMHPNLTYVVRGGPVINDATMDDAEYTGMEKYAKVISNGYDAPSTILNKSSREFQKYFSEADLIISKGQGNLEGLIPINDERIFFLLMVKCDVIADSLGVTKDSLAVCNQLCLVSS